MKKLKVTILSVIAVLPILIACEKTEIRSYGAISFGRPAVSQPVFTKAASNNGILVGPNECGYDTFSVFSEEAGMNPFTVQWNGTDWAYDGIGSQELQYFDKNYAEYKFIGIISDQDGVYSNGSVKVESVEAFLTEDETSTPKEFLWAGTTVSRDAYTSQVSLAFAHGNAKMYIGFASDRNDTRILNYVPNIPAVPDQNDTLDTWFNLKRSSGNVDGSATKTRVKTGENWGEYVDNYELPAALVNEIKSYYSVDGSQPGDYDLHMGNTVWPSSTIKQLRIVKPIPAEYKLSCQIYTTDITVDFFDGFKYLRDNGYDIQPRNSGGKPDVWNYVLIDAFVNGTAYTVVGLNATGSQYSVPQYTIEVTTGTPGTSGIDGIRVFAVDASSSPIVRTVHTTAADATVTTTDNTFDNPTSVDEVITFAAPLNVDVAQYANRSDITLTSDVTLSPSVWYAVPILNTAYVVKFSYVYNGVSHYDARVLIPEASADFGQSEYYKYVIYIDGNTGGVVVPEVAETDKNEVDTSEKPIIFSNITFGTYNGNLIVI